MRSHLALRAARRAFTIIELLIAISITALIATFMVTILSNVLTVWSRSTATLTTGNQARLILDQLSTDLQGAVLRRSADAMFVATIPQTQGATGDAGMANASWAGDVKPSGATSFELGTTAAINANLAEYRFGQAGTWLRFFTTPPDNSNPTLQDQSAPRAVSYQIVRRRLGSTSSPFGYQLYRAEARPFHNTPALATESTFRVGYDLLGEIPATTTANRYNNSPLTPGDDEPTPPLFPLPNPWIGDAANIRRPAEAQLLGTGVIDFGVRVFVLQNGVPIEAFPVDRRVGPTADRRVFVATTDTNKIHPAGALPSGNFTSAQTSYGYPVVVEVMVRVLSTEGAELLNAYETEPAAQAAQGGYSAARWWELAEQNSQVFTRRISLPATALVQP